MSDLTFVLPPIQRKRWDDDDALPHVNWGDLFFDLFYVGAAFNLAILLKDGIDDGFISLLYFLGCFGPIFSNFWETKLFYDARFQLQGDLVHRIIEVIQLCFLALAANNIRPADTMKLGEDQSEMFVFCLSNLMGCIIHLGHLFEIGYIWVKGDEEAAAYHVKTDMISNVMVAIMTLVASVYSGCLFYSDSTQEESKAENHVAITLLLGTWLCRPLFFFFAQWYRGMRGKDIEFLTMVVPMNMQYIIHRFGEWTMLVLGESILSLVVVDDIAEHMQGSYNLTFYSGVLTVVLLQVLFFKIQPHEGKDHALRRSVDAGIMYMMLIQFYSAALIVLGASFEMLLIEYTGKYATEYETRRLGGSAPEYGLSAEERRLKTARNFCIGLSAVIVLLDFITICHCGITKKTIDKMKRKGLFLIICSRVVIIGTVIVVYRFISEHPSYVALLGFGSVLLQVAILFLCKKLYHADNIYASIRNSQDAPGINASGIDMMRASVQIMANIQNFDWSETLDSEVYKSLNQKFYGNLDIGSDDDSDDDHL